MRAFLVAALVATSATAWAQFRLPKGEEEVNQASALMVQGRYNEAGPILRQAVADAPRDPYAHFNLAAVLRETGWNDEAIEEYQRAKHLFLSVGPRANGEGDIANCLYGIALAQEAKGDVQAAAGAWEEYVKFAQRYPQEGPAVAIAREHVESNKRLARVRGPFAPERASRGGSVVR